MPIFSRAEMDRRHEALRRRMAAEGLDAVVATSYTAFYHLSGAPVHPYGRPIALVVPARGEPAIVEAIIERAHTIQQTWIRDIRNYWDYNPTPVFDRPRPPLESLVHHLEQVLRDRDLLDKRVGIEEAALPFGHYEAFRAVLPQVRFVGVSDILDRLRLVKSDEELALIRAADDVCDVGQAMALEIVRPGHNSAELNVRLWTAMVEHATTQYPDMPFNIHSRIGLEPVSKSAGHSEWAGWGRGDLVKAGQVLEMVFSAWLWGYWGNVERAVSIGEPTARQRELLEIMVESNEVGIAAVRPGVALADIDRACKGVLVKHGLETPTGTGVGRGLTSYEGNARELKMDVRLYADVVLEPGMTFSIEPHVREHDVIYRHCNTIIVTERGCEVDSRIPRGVLRV